MVDAVTTSLPHGITTMLPRGRRRNRWHLAGDGLSMTAMAAALGCGADTAGVRADDPLAQRWADGVHEGIAVHGVPWHVTRLSRRGDLPG